MMKGYYEIEFFDFCLLEGLTSVVGVMLAMGISKTSFRFCVLRGFKRYEEINLCSDLKKSFEVYVFPFWSKKTGEAYAAA